MYHRRSRSRSRSPYRRPVGGDDRRDRGDRDRAPAAATAPPAREPAYVSRSEQWRQDYERRQRDGGDYRGDAGAQPDGRVRRLPSPDRGGRGGDGGAPPPRRDDRARSPSPRRQRFSPSSSPPRRPPAASDVLPPPRAPAAAGGATVRPAVAMDVVARVVARVAGMAASDAGPGAGRYASEPSAAGSRSSYGDGGGGGGAGDRLGRANPAHATGAAAPPPPPPPPPSTKPDFGLSGALVDDRRSGHVFNGVTLKWAEPSDAAAPPAGAPDAKWQLHVFKGGAALADAPLKIHRQSAFLVGRDRRVADVVVDHPSCSSQHAVIQFRAVPVVSASADAGGDLDDDGAADADGGGGPRRVVKPYVMDLESTNGTFLNGNRVDAARYVELRPFDVLKFGLSTREYVLMHEGLAR